MQKYAYSLLAYKCINLKTICFLCWNIPLVLPVYCTGQPLNISSGKKKKHLFFKTTHNNASVLWRPKHICLNHSLICLLFEPGKWHLRQQPEYCKRSAGRSKQHKHRFGYLQHGDSGGKKVTHVNLTKANICHVNASLQLPHFTQHSIERLLAGTANVFKPW